MTNGDVLPTRTVPFPHRPDLAGRRFVAIQALRAVAALLVVFEHLKNDMLRIFLDRDPLQSAWAGVPFSAGVDVFFVISGFVIAHSSASLHGRPGAWKTFLTRRVARVVPLYWLLSGALAVLAVTVLDPALYFPDASYLVASFLFVPAPNVQGAILPLLPLGWTLNYEMAFYLVFALFVGLRQGRALALVAVTLLAVVAWGRIDPPSSVALVFWTDAILLEFLAGIGVYVALARGFSLPNGVRLALVPVAVALLLWLGEPNLPWRWLFWGGPATLLVLAAVSGRPRSGRPFGQHLWEMLGDVSYAVYLSHLFVLIGVRRLLLAFGLTGDFVVFVVFPVSVLAITLGVSWALNRLFEKPVLHVLRRRFDASLTAGPGSAPGP